MKLSIKGIVTGALADVLLSGALGAVLILYAASSHGLSRLPRGELQSAVADAIHASTWLYICQIVIGFGCSILGGYVAAGIAKNDRLLNGVLASWLCLAIGIVSLVSGKEVGSFAGHLALLAATPLAYWLGALIRVRRIVAAQA